MEKLHYSLTFCAPGSRTVCLQVVVSFRGLRESRMSYKIQGLTYATPDPKKFWDKKTLRFVDGTIDAQNNNPILDELCALCDRLINNPEVKSPSEFIQSIKSGYAPDEIPWGEWIQKIIDDEKYCRYGKLPAKHYQNFINLYNKCKGCRIDGVDLRQIPLAQISNTHFKKFGEYLRKIGCSNYVRVMSYFKTIHKRALEEELNTNALVYPYKKYAPVTAPKEKKPALTLDQVNQFRQLDLSLLPRHHPQTIKEFELMRDIVLFMYEAKCRPVDAIRAHSNDIVTATSGVKCYRYIPEKKKNTKAYNKIVFSPLNDAALSIIEKYKGKSSKGYLFPIEMNEYKWDFTNSESWNKWYVQAQHVEGKINKFLKKVEIAMGVDFRITQYTFRHSTITHAFNEGKSAAIIALNAGTSTPMLEQHYVDNTQVLW